MGREFSAPIAPRPFRPSFRGDLSYRVPWPRVKGHLGGPANPGSKGRARRRMMPAPRRRPLARRSPRSALLQADDRTANAYQIEALAALDEAPLSRCPGRFVRMLEIGARAAGRTALRLQPRSRHERLGSCGCRDYPGRRLLGRSVGTGRSTRNMYAAAVVAMRIIGVPVGSPDCDATASHDRRDRGCRTISISVRVAVAIPIVGITIAIVRIRVTPSPIRII
jgi:hypothetical protein